MDKSKPNKKLQGIYVSGTTAGSVTDTFSKFQEKIIYRAPKIKALRFFVARKRLQESKAWNRKKKSCRMQLRIKVRPPGRTTGGTGRRKTMIRLHEMQLGIFSAAGTPFQAAAYYLVKIQH